MCDKQGHICQLWMALFSSHYTDIHEYIFHIAYAGPPQITPNETQSYRPVCLVKCGTWTLKHWAVREITKSSNTFAATNININIVWFLSLHDNVVWNFIFGTKFSSIYLAKGENVWFFDYNWLTCSVRKMVLMCLMQNVDMCLLYKSHQIARLVSHLIITFPNEFLPCNKKCD